MIIVSYKLVVQHWWISLMLLIHYHLTFKRFEPIFFYIFFIFSNIFLNQPLIFFFTDNSACNIWSLFLHYEMNHGCLKNVFFLAPCSSFASCISVDIIQISF